MAAPLTIYRASAGSGKTFRLVVEYIKLLVLRPDEYRHILAVTFTKKATQEMKTRILSQLYGLREGLSSSANYMDCITKEMNVPEHEVRKNAGKALELILNDYGRFRIETIDAFFQRVLRNMTRELDINSNMRIELNGKQVKNKAIDDLINNLEPTDYVFKRIVSFAEENMEEGKTWNIIHGLKDFGENIFTDFYQSHSADYQRLLEGDENIVATYSKYLRETSKIATQNIVNSAAKLRQVFDDNNIDVSILKNSNKSGLGKLYQYIENGDVLTIPATLLKYAESTDEWFKKADQSKYGTQIIEDVLQPALRQYLDKQKRLAKQIITTKVILRNLNNIELLGTIENAVKDSNLSANRFLLSYTNQLLADMINDADSPFIYEKIGTYISHLMIDEFQDTSTLQWHNFKHLLLESMSHYDAETASGTVGNMIVGDVKQSIYRWRNGDWRLLDNIKQEFPYDSDTEIETLDTNYRSAANIVNFNNAFFEAAKTILGIDSAYEDVSQKPKPGSKSEGEVKFIMLQKEDYSERHKMICDHVADLISRGVKAKDIAILGRNNEILKELSKVFLTIYPDIHIVSLESFQINNSTAVNTIICALRLLLNPKDKIRLATLAQKSGFTTEECLKLLKDIDINNPLIDVVETVFQTFNIEKMEDDNAYTSAFFDRLKVFTAQNTATLKNFIKFWDESLCNTTIETEAEDGVQMLTIHKSKGLEFDNVIIADGAWKDDVSKNSIWVEVSDKEQLDVEGVATPEESVPFTLIKATKELENSIFAEEYEEECLQNTVDNLNLLYVAFTRASKNLYYYGQADGNNGISKLVQQCIETLDFDSEETIGEKGYIKQTGAFAHSVPKSKEESKNVFDMPVSSITIPVHVNSPQAEFKQSNRSKQFIDEKEQSYLSLGLLLHNVLSNIATLDDVENVLQQLEAEGIMADKRHANLIRKRIQESRYAKEWFTQGWTVYNECSILTPDGTKRPDRVITNGKETIVIDFKFGTSKPEYREQILTYKTLLEQMDFPNVKAYLWYVYNDTVEEIIA